MEKEIKDNNKVILEKKNTTNKTSIKKVIKNKPCQKITIVCISDTHSHTDELNLPKGDILIHAGDFSNIGSIKCLEKFRDFIAKQDFKHKIIIAGNHDWTLSNMDYERNYNTWAKYMIKEGVPETTDKAKEYLKDFIYLENSSVELYGLNFYGSPLSVKHPLVKNWGFMPTEETLKTDYWPLIPDNTDILITHSPPYDIMDQEFDDYEENDIYGNLSNMHWGSVSLAMEINSRIRPSVHVFGHSHDPNGYEFDLERNIAYVNASICDNSYNPSNTPKVITIDVDGSIKFEHHFKSDN